MWDAQIAAVRGQFQTVWTNTARQAHNIVVFLRRPPTAIFTGDDTDVSKHGLALLTVFYTGLGCLVPRHPLWTLFHTALLARSCVQDPVIALAHAEVLVLEGELQVSSADLCGKADDTSFRLEGPRAGLPQNTVASALVWNALEIADTYLISIWFLVLFA